MNYTRTELENALCVDGIYTVHYFEYVKDFAYSGEFHDFWELVYADRKSLVLTAGAKEVRLEAGQMYIHKPNEFHNIRPDDKSTANSVVISFDSGCAELSRVAGTVITCSQEEKRLIGGIIREAENAFSTPLGNPYTAVMEKAIFVAAARLDCLNALNALCPMQAQIPEKKERRKKQDD